MLNMELIKLIDSKRKNKRYNAVFKINDKIKNVHFGSDKHENYTLHNDKERRARYRSRHKKDNINNPISAGALSWHLLWGDSTNLNENIKKFKKKFDV
mmetsp:Transcript_23478/g.27577  ORF Transcript_23478/g.27577 Transcript_23478/m.27577 type:complete len:98 (+) Transcript_23478:85-378(+)